MRVDYDSQADALDIRLIQFDRYEHQEQVRDSYCTVGFADGRVVDIEVLSPAAHLDLLGVVAERYDLDGGALLAAAKAGLAAPDRVVELEVGVRLAA
ncbi:MAG TPA: DUF2283 domain-containing protein [Solirubrobacterales bacterium]